MNDAQYTREKFKYRNKLRTLQYKIVTLKFDQNICQLGLK